MCYLPNPDPVVDSQAARVVAGVLLCFVIEILLENQREFLKLQKLDLSQEKHYEEWHMKFGTQNHDGEISIDDLLDGQCVTQQGFQDVTADWKTQK